MDLYGRSFLKDTDLSPAEYAHVLGLSARLREEKLHGAERRRLSGKNIALIFEKPSTGTRSAFEVAAHDQGAHGVYLGPGDSRVGLQESAKDTARVLGRMFDGIEFRGFRQTDAEVLDDFSGVPVWNGLTDEWHPTQALADLLTMHDHAGRPLTEVSVSFVGDAANSTCASLLTAGALLGMDVRIAAPKARRPSVHVWRQAACLAAASGGSLLLTDDPLEAVDGTDFLYTDVWLSPSEPEELWEQRIELLRPYQVSSSLVAATGNPDVRLLHCLPSFHDTSTDIGRRVRDQFGIDAMEVTDEVFESKISLVFDQAENRLHTIKAIMVATLSRSDE